MEETSWTPEQKVMGSAVAVIILYIVQILTGTEVPMGVEGAVAVLVAYFLPNRTETV